MKFLIIQENGRHAISRHLRECHSLQRGILFHNEECDVWGLGHDNFNIKPQFNNYDVIINLENYDTGWVPNLKNINKPIKLLWAIDSHCRTKKLYINTFLEGKYTKILESTKYYLDKYSVWFPNCYDSFIIKPLNEIDKKYFLGFCGNYVNRKPLFDFISQQIPDFKLDIDVRGMDMIKAINSYFIHFNKNISIDINYRNFETLGCGTCLLTDYNEQYQELGFKNQEHFFYYKTINEIFDILKYLKDNPQIIKQVAQNGHEFVKNKHTYINRAKSLIKFIKQL